MVFKDREETRCSHHAWRFESCGLEEGRGKFAKVDEVTDDAAGLRDSSRPADGEGDPGTVIVEASFGTGERHPVVAGDDDDGVVELTGFF